jgi:hypothetical protein
MPPRYATNPDPRYKPALRLTQGLAVAASLSNGVAVDEYVAVSGSARVRARIKATAAGALDMTFGYFKDDAFTAYTTGNPTQVAVSANTEAKIESDTYGEAYVRIRYTPSANGAVTFADVCQA